MAFHPPQRRLALPIMAMSAMILSAAAQPSGQPIIFSAPKSVAESPVAPSLAPPSVPPELPATMRAPVAPFSYNVPDNFPEVPPADAAGQQRMKKMLDDRKNWTLMTPEEIFGVTTTEKPEERDALGRKKNQTQLERYLERENQSSTSRTNGWNNDRENLTRDLSHAPGQTNALDVRRSDSRDGLQSLNQFFNGQRNGDVSMNQNETVSWDVFNPPAQQMPVKPDLERLAAMKRFRQLLQPDSAPAVSLAPKPAMNQNFTQPAFVPNLTGMSSIPLSSGIGKPAGLTPLPGATSHFLQPMATPAWVPKPAPWTSSAPQPFAPPPWKF